jgi:cell shape-determining protein MreC
VQALKNEPEALASQIDGLFDGWGPNRAITLTNGQVWQINDGSSAVLYLKSPQVKIRRGILGTFVLELDGTNETAKVRRLR